MDILFEREVGSPEVPLTARVLMTDRSDGDLAGPTWPTPVISRIVATGDPLSEDVSLFRQVHGAEVMAVEHPGGNRGADADAAVTTAVDAPLAIRVADCVPVGFVSSAGAIGVAHAGWRGLQAGVLEATLSALLAASRSSTPVTDPGHVTAVVGPCIGPECYEFGPEDLNEMADQFGPSVRSHTASGSDALDMSAAVRSELARLEIDNVVWSNPCTSCDADRFWSWRARRDAGRQAMVVVIQ